jgi:uncharacterized membrane protein HdeD (DUF308 family)
VVETSSSSPDDRRRKVATAVRTRVSSKLGDVWWAFMVRGALAAVLGLVILIWPSATVAVVMILAGLFCLADGAAGLFGAIRGGERGAHFVQALISLGVGAILLFWPGGSVRVLLIVFGIWILFTGVSQIMAARRDPADLGEERSALNASGWILAAVGLILIVWPGTGVVAIGWLIAIPALAVAALLIFVALRLKRVKDRMDTPTSAGAAR